MFYQGNYVGLDLTPDAVARCSGSGPRDLEVAQVVQTIRRDLTELDAEKVRLELREYGAWSPEELADDERNLHRLVWVFAGHLRDEHASALGVFTNNEKNLIAEIVHRKRGFARTIDNHPGLEEKLLAYFYEHGMPYGVAKARTGDPLKWVEEHLHELHKELHDAAH